MTRFPRTFALPFAAVFAGLLFLTGCSSNDASRSAALLGDGAEDINVEFGFSKSTRVCVINESTSSIEVAFSKADNVDGQGSLARGGKVCGRGTFYQGDDVVGTISAAKSGRNYAFAAVNKNADLLPSAALQPEGCSESRSSFFENASSNKSDDVMKFTVKRLKDTAEYKEFTITAFDESRPASSPRSCW